MASLMEDFIDTLNKEDEEYQKLLLISRRKTPIIVKGDTENLAKITEEEQVVVDKINNLDKHREEILNDIATVLNRDVQELKIPRIVELLKGQTKEQEQLQDVYNRLKVTTSEMKAVNEENSRLIKLSLEMVQFDMTLLQSMKQGPETGAYNSQGGYNDSGMIRGAVSRFDSKR